MGADYPKQLLTIVVWVKEKEVMKGVPEKGYLGKELCITGKVELYKGTPQIVFNSSLNK